MNKNTKQNLPKGASDKFKVIPHQELLAVIKEELNEITSDDVAQVYGITDDVFINGYYSLGSGSVKFAIAFKHGNTRRTPLTFYAGFVSLNNIFIATDEIYLKGNTHSFTSNLSEQVAEALHTALLLQRETTKFAKGLMKLNSSLKGLSNAQLVFNIIKSQRNNMQRIPLRWWGSIITKLIGKSTHMDVLETIIRYGMQFKNLKLSVSLVNTIKVLTGFYLK